MLGAHLSKLQRERACIRVSSAVVGQVWRDGRKQANLSRLLAGVRIDGLLDSDGRRVGELLAAAGSSDIVDAHVALMTAPHDVVLTSDPDDIRALLEARGVRARVVAV